MKHLLFLVFSLCVFSSNALSGPFETIAEELNTEIFSFLDPMDIGKSTTVSPYFHKIGNKDSKYGKSLREESKFHVITAENNVLFLREYLKGPRQAISRIDNLALLLKEYPSDFIKLMLHSIPHTPETIDSDLRTFHQDTFKVDNLISSVPTYETAQQKLAGVLIELMTWDQVWAQVWDQVNEDLRHCQFASAFEDGNLNEVLKPAIDYAFTVYQLGTLAMRHSEAFKSIHTNFAQFISERITEDQAAVILNGLNIPGAPEGNYLIDTQLKLINRLLPVFE